ncbi:MAG: parallel beta-helix repeat-containing protein, partial [Parcubacteria group bacterium Gr01-1014_72]
MTGENSPYIVQRYGLSVSQGLTLTIEPGVVIKISDANEPSISISGKLIAQGKADNPIVITSIYDDEYGGDTNKDGI